MGNALLIERLYAQRRRAILRLQGLECKAAIERTAIAKTEADLRGLVLFVVPFEQRKPHPHFKPGELSRLCRAVLRERKSRSLYSGQIATAVMGAKGLSPSDPKLAPLVFRQTQDALRRMWRRGSVTKAGHGVRARWGLPAAE
jgi:hypothetical protein